MRIAIASDDGLNVALHTGRCRGFVIYDVANEHATRGEYRENNMTAHSQGQCQDGHSHSPGESHHSHGSLLAGLSDCTALVTRGLGPRLIADLLTRGIATHICAVDQADEAASQFARGVLPRATGGGGCCCHHP